MAREQHLLGRDDEVCIAYGWRIKTGWVSWGSSRSPFHGFDTSGFIPASLYQPLYVRNGTRCILVFLTFGVRCHQWLHFAYKSLSRRMAWAKKVQWSRYLATRWHGKLLLPSGRGAAPAVSDGKSDAPGRVDFNPSCPGFHVRPSHHLSQDHPSVSPFDFHLRRGCCLGITLSFIYRYC